MWMRLLAMTRRPESSSILVTAPVRLRRVASGLMIEKVRVTAMGLSSGRVGRFARAPSGRGRSAQAARRRVALHFRADKAPPGNEGSLMVEPRRIRAGILFAAILASLSLAPALGQEP